MIYVEASFCVYDLELNFSVFSICSAELRAWLRALSIIRYLKKIFLNILALNTVTSKSHIHQDSGALWKKHS